MGRIMNRAFKVIWNVSRQVWMVTGELTRGKSKSSTAKKVASLILAALPAFTSINSNAGGLAPEVMEEPVVVVDSPSSADTYWVGATGDWFTAGNWDTIAVPTSADSTYIDNGGTAQVSLGTAEAAALYAGKSGNGTLDISNGGNVNVNLGTSVVAFDSGSTGSVTVDGTGSSWNNSLYLYVGNLGSGTLDITNGGAVSNNYGVVAYGAGSTSSVTVDGTGSRWNNSQNLYVGYFGDGTLDITNGGTVNVNSGTGIVTLALNAGSIGTLNIGAASGDTAVSAGTLNAASVVFGAGTGSVVFNHTEAAYNFSPAIAGAGSIGLFSGSTRFTGDLTSHTGTLTVDGGNLAINSNETLSLGGNYALAAASTHNVNVTNDATYSKLFVTGTATLASNAKININVANPNFAFTTALTNGMLDIISADTLISDGTFAVTDNSLLFNFGAVKDSNTVDLTLTSAATVQSSINTNSALGAAAAIDSIILDDPTGEIASSFVSLTTQQEVIDAIESLSPTASGGMAQMTGSVTSAVTSVVDSRQDESSGISSGDDFMTDRHIWFKPFGGWAEQDTRQGVTGYDVDSYGLAFGFDGDVTSSWNVGAALAYINSDVASTLAAGAQGVDIDSYLAKVYATNMLDATTALNLQAGFGLSNYDSNRRIFTGDVASADYDSWNVQLSAELTRSYQVSDKTVISPYVHTDYSYVNVDGYSESGAGAFNLNVNDDSNDSLVIGTGLKGNHAVSDSLLLMANAGIGYDVMTDRNSLTSSFAGGGAQFTTEGIEPDEWVYNAGLGAKYSLENGTEITASYNINTRQDFTDQSVSANFRMLF